MTVAQPKRFLNIAHRGFSARYPENTLLAFEKALDVGVGWIELDVQTTSDGVPVVIHDATVDRTTDGSGRVDAMTLDEVKALDAGSHRGESFAGLRVPSLDETLDSLVGRTRLVIELKMGEPASVSDVVEAVEARGMTEDVTYSAFHRENLRAVSAILAGASLNPLGGMAGRSIAEVIEETHDLKAKTLGMVAADATEELAEAAHAAGLLLRCSGAADDTGPEIRRLIAIGADGLTTNHPDVLQAILQEEGIAPF
jgi:glycerophosphoryl diester phosphodiesterase